MGFIAGALAALAILQLRMSRPPIWHRAIHLDHPMPAEAPGRGTLISACTLSCREQESTIVLSEIHFTAQALLACSHLGAMPGVTREVTQRASQALGIREEAVRSLPGSKFQRQLLDQDPPRRFRWEVLRAMVDHRHERVLAAEWSVVAAPRACAVGLVARLPARD